MIRSSGCSPGTPLFSSAFLLIFKLSPPIHLPHGTEDPDSIPYGVDFRLTPLRPVPVLDRHGTDCHFTLQCKDRHFCFYFKPVGLWLKTFYKFPAKRPASGHDIRYVRMEQPVDQTLYEPVPERVDLLFVLFIIGRGESVADDHIGAFTDPP